MKSKVFVKTDSQNHIICCDGGYTIGNIANIDDWILIDEGYGDKYNLCQSNYFDKPLITEGGVYQYKLVSVKEKTWRECTAEEIAAQEEANKPAEPEPAGNLEQRVAAMESDVAALTTAIEKGLAL